MLAAKWMDESTLIEMGFDSADAPPVGPPRPVLRAWRIEEGQAAEPRRFASDAPLFSVGGPPMADLWEFSSLATGDGLVVVTYSARDDPKNCLRREHALRCSDSASLSAAFFACSSYPGLTASHASHSNFSSGIPEIKQTSHFHPVFLKVSPHPPPPLGAPADASLSSPPSSSSSVPISDSLSPNNQSTYQEENFFLLIFPSSPKH